MLRLDSTLKGLGVMTPGWSFRLASLLSVLVELLLFAISRDLQAAPEECPDHHYPISCILASAIKTHLNYISYISVSLVWNANGTTLIFLSQNNWIMYVHANRNREVPISWIPSRPTRLSRVSRFSCWN